MGAALDVTGRKARAMVMRTQSGILGQTISVKPIAKAGIPLTLVLPRIQGNGDGRVGTARELPEVLLGLGFDPDPLIASTGIDPRTLDDSETTLSSAALGSLLEACVAQTGCPHVGLLVGARAKTSCFGLVGLLMQHAPTVAEALQCLIDHGHLYYPGVVTTLEARDGTAVLRYALSPADADGAVQIVDSALATGFRIVRALCGDDWLPSEVLLSHPAHGRELAYRQVFGVPIRCNVEVTALVFPARWLDQPVPGADPGFRHILEVQVGVLEHQHDEALSSQLRRSLRTLLLRKGCSAGRTAHLFAMHQRTMSRRLKAEGQSFQHLVDEVRYDIARHLLSSASMPLAEIAVALGYSEASAFTRAFRRWSGLSPKAWRLGKATSPLIAHEALASIGRSARRHVEILHAS